MPGQNSYRYLWMLGLAITLPMILLSGPLAGYLIAQLLVKQFKLNLALIPGLMALGLAGSGVQAFQLIRKLNQNSNKES